MDFGKRKKNSKTRNILEMIHIKREKEAMNFKKDTQNLAQTYLNLIK